MKNYNYKAKKKKKDDGKQGMDDGCVPGCIDFFLWPLQLSVLGYQIIINLS
ncbi:hypothetical protein [Bacillus cihuensis]|uniref:hypothetical protein n=1 Tax=Bacillus cihuensis TaxID=1208599 RepID=UPI0004213B40|nr:hypothetical protein [Bacillus cihuensis]